MSKFEELCNVYTKAREEYFAYREQSFCFAQKMIDGYIKFLEIPKEYFCFVPLDKVPEPNTSYTLFGAVHLNRDTYWHLGIQITLFSKLNVYPHQLLLIKFMFKRHSKNHFIVKISNEDKEHRIKIDEDSDFESFYKFLQSQIESNFKDELQEFLEQSASLKTIGFMQS